jgi:hypothetical protein
MKALLRNTFAITLAVLVLASTGGFTVFRHSCNTQKTSELSFIFPSFECEHIATEENSCGSCCGAEEIPSGESYDSQKCCDTETIVVKLDLNFEIQETLKLATAVPLCIFLDTETMQEVSNTEIIHIITSNNLPPPLSGKALHIYLHQLNIPYQTV